MLLQSSESKRIALLGPQSRRAVIAQRGSMKQPYYFFGTALLHLTAAFASPAPTEGSTKLFYGLIKQRDLADRAGTFNVCRPGIELWLRAQGPRSSGAGR